ncbi:MAG TPA: phosphoglycerate kinase [Polyangiaceae bacterium]|nr:phosphoglycerate kinase [Polyangiaceae bacterium]
MPLPSLDKLPALDSLDLHGQRVLVRVDLNAAPGDMPTLSVLVDVALPTVRQLLGAGARVILASHCQGAADEELPSLETAGALLAERLNCDLYLPEDVTGDAARKVTSDLRSGQLALLENLARDPGELSGDEVFARKLSNLCDVYVNDAPSLLDRKLASLIHLPRLAPERTIGLSMSTALAGLHQLEAFRGKLCCVFSSTTLNASLLRELQGWLSRVDALIVVDAASSAFVAAAPKNAPAAAAWPAEVLAHCRSLITTAQTRDKKLLWPPPGLAAEALSTWLKDRLPAGPLLLVGPWPHSELSTATLNALLAQRVWAGAAGIEAVTALQVCDPAVLGTVALRGLNSEVVLRALTGDPLPALTALSAAV